MGISESELLQLVIQPTLKLIDDCNEYAQQCLTSAASACHLGDNLTPKHGPGLGVYGITPGQHRALWDTYLIHHHDLASQVRGLASQRAFLIHPDEELITNLRYATAIAWLLIRQYIESNNLSLTTATISDVVKAVFGQRSCHIAA
ncbi:hypothetical protein QWY82_12450 [Simiduia curdlanivorans]|uniref:Uncharacterized protein n=1 Tax=Simiduia curdlanivorans TaxID=1492769 RepID=A0ABV8V836_9GAMM|nr:hypothetical protein [Simiduia curdlanivorans]MDN3639609.1 hypothetical protein [Simiduia curdlanivorans]